MPIFLNNIAIFVLLGVWVVQIHFYFRGKQTTNPTFQNVLFAVWWVSLCSIAFSVLYAVADQYVAWTSDPIGQYLLPPHRSIGYFISYSGARHAANPLIAVAAAILLGTLAMRLNTNFGERFFEKEEPRLFALGAALSGYPGFLFYIALVFLAGVSLAVWYAISKKERAPLYFLWLPMAMFAILITNFALSRELLVLFNL